MQFDAMFMILWAIVQRDKKCKKLCSSQLGKSKRKHQIAWCTIYNSRITTNSDQLQGITMSGLYKNTAYTIQPQNIHDDWTIQDYMNI